MEPETQRVLWTPEEPEKRAGEAPEAFLLRQAAQHPPMRADAPEGQPDPAEALLALVDQTAANALWPVAFKEIWRRYEEGELTQPVFTAYCAAARKHQSFAHPWGYHEGAPRWTGAPCCVWEAFVFGKSPNDMEHWMRLGLLRDDVLTDYQQVWRRVAPRFSDTWAEHETTPLRPRTAEALELFLNPVRRAPIDRAAEALAASRRWQALYGPRGM
jgi:hypothetical protein